MPPQTFDHEKLHVYQRSIQFSSWAGELLQRIPKNHTAHNQLDRASTSIPLNIAEGTGKTTPPGSLPLFRHRTRIRRGVRGMSGCSFGEKVCRGGGNPSGKRDAS